MVLTDVVASSYTSVQVGPLGPPEDPLRCFADGVALGDPARRGTAASHQRDVAGSMAARRGDLSRQRGTILAMVSGLWPMTGTSREG